MTDRLTWKRYKSIARNRKAGKLLSLQLTLTINNQHVLIIFCQQFQGNFDNNTIVRHAVPRPAMVRKVHIIPTEWKDNFALRLELYGCIAG